MALPLGILDQSPVLAGAQPRDAVLATLELARAAEALGYGRYWLAEHHAMRGLSDPAPEVLLARLTAETARMRIGSGGVLLPHQAALKVAEQFRMLEALAPGRVDLGIGRAPGGSRRVSEALESRDVQRFPEQVRDLCDFLDGTLAAEHPHAKLVAMPSGESAPEVWLLGSSDYSAALAAEMGLPFAFAHFISGDAEAVTRMYRRHFRPSRRAAEPRVILALAAIVADTPDEAEQLAAVLDLWRLRIRRGIDLPVPSLEEAHAYPRTPYEREEIAYNRQRLALGAPRAVRERIETLAAAHAADEAMVLTIAPDYGARLRSYELLAQAFTAEPQAAQDARRLEVRENDVTSSRLPAVFFGHGSPMNAIERNRYTEAWSALAAGIPRPRAILAISAHWFVDGIAATAAEHPATIHDFGGFPRALYEIVYPAPGDAELVRRVQQLLAPASVRADGEWGLDHGVWSVLRHAYPDASIPVVALSIDRTQPNRAHFELGRRLAPLRDEGVLISCERQHRSQSARLRVRRRAAAAVRLGGALRRVRARRAAAERQRGADRLRARGTRRGALRADPRTLSPAALRRRYARPRRSGVVSDRRTRRRRRRSRCGASASVESVPAALPGRRSGRPGSSCRVRSSRIAQSLGLSAGAFAAALAGCGGGGGGAGGTGAPPPPA